MFSPEDIGNILRAIAEDKKAQETKRQIEDDKDKEAIKQADELHDSADETDKTDDSVDKADDDDADKKDKEYR